ncbi:hypothetical protein Dsin_002992 [Dipteronia sinensis]|uniref:Uncharacterized protein n=1 Tax=Dipteronia sinensis TaxID=43782 RepID=A0AAE0EJY0_9ROSI|nr:hypothetical protein Dsin_002992 [Dipteronia sinensis]
MERTPSSSSNNTDGAGLLSCCGRLKLKLPWTKRRVWSDTRRARHGSEGCNIAAVFQAKQPKPIGKFGYDPLSYAQNFDEGRWDDDDEYFLSHGFSSRYAAPNSSKSLEDK